jgi:hypothetical protein
VSRLFPLGVLVLAFVPVALSQSGTNLLQNPGAEAAAGATNSSAVAVPPGWKPAGPFTAVAYGSPGFPVSGPGKNFFAGGPGASRSSGTQVVDVSSYAAAIDGGGVQATLSGLLGGFETQEDSATVEATFLDQSGAPVSSEELRIGPVTTAQRDGVTKLLPKAATAAVPPQTRKVEVVITAERASGFYNDGYVDDVSLILQASSRPRPAAAKTYLWSGTVVAFGDSGSTLYSETISGNGSARTKQGSSTVVSAPGDVRVVFFYRRPKGKKRVLSLRSTGAAKLAARSGGGGTFSVGLRITRSDFGNCHKDASGNVTLVDGAGKAPDSMVLSACGTRTRYVDGGSHQMRVRVTIGERR